MPDPQDEDVCFPQLVPQLIIGDDETADLSRVELG
jgi:hypothetical protein